ncbi:protein-disulfide reductase DsbD [Chitinibacteraceae bacterium HSL-7]
MIRIFLAFLLACVSTLATAQTELLPPDEAFRATVTRIDAHTLGIRFEVTPQYYLYRDRISASVEPGSATRLTLPRGELKDDPTFGQVEVYHQNIDASLYSESEIPDSATTTVQFQGCSDVGVCYPPQTVTLALGERSGPKGALDALFGKSRPTTQPAAVAAAPAQPQTDSTFFGQNRWATLALFLVAGIGLALTACMYPLLPIVSSIVIGQGHKRLAAFLLTVVYVQGMALTYTLAGLAAAASGTLLVVALQQTWVIVATSLLFVAMAIAMFGGFQFQLPSSAQTLFNRLAHRLPGGHILPVFLMGAVSALIVGPCVAPPLVAALAYLGQSGDIALGGASLYMLALGMGVPLMAVGAFGATVLPKLSHRVMASVKVVFGLVLLATAIWTARPLWLHWLPAAPTPVFVAVSSGTELDQALAGARGKPVMLDLYADWCVSCIEFERETLTDAKVQQQLERFVLLRADLTANQSEHQAILRRFGLYGPPALLFFDANGQEMPAHRVVGFQDAATFSATLDRIAE